MLNSKNNIFFLIRHNTFFLIVFYLHHFFKPINIDLVVLTYLWNVLSFKQINGLEEIHLLATDRFTRGEEVLDVLHLFKRHVATVDLLHTARFDDVDQPAQDLPVLQLVYKVVFRTSLQNKQSD